MKRERRRNHTLSPLLIMILFFTVSGFTQTREYWLKTERKGMGFAYDHITIHKLENGNFEYHIDQHTKTDVAGLNPQDIIQKGSYVVNANLLPVSFDFYFKFRAKKAHITGKYKNGRMHLTVEDEEGKILRREIPFEDTYFPATLMDIILKNENKKVFNLKIFDPLELKVNDVQIEITKSDEEEVQATVTEKMTSKYRIDRQGQIKEIEFVEIRVRTYQTDAEDAQNIVYLNTADGFTLTVSSKKSFPNVYKIIKAQIQVKWKDIPFEKFNFEDNRQKVIRKISSNGEYEVVLEIAKPIPPSKETITPVKDEKFAPFLKDTEYIKPNDPSIQQQLAEIQGNEKNALAIVQKILDWISTNIKTDMIAETLTGPEVLEKRKGKCSEYAILFASFARAAGIPTRIVLGELNSGNRWIGHMWNEVWLDRWTAVDPAGSMFVTGPSHIKFIHSPTVMGTQHVRWKLVDNLSIEILDFKEEESKAITQVETGIIGLTYFNSDFLCKISAPDETWLIEEAARRGLSTIRIRPKNEEDVIFALVLFAVPPGTSAKTLLNKRLKAIAGMAKNFCIFVTEW